MLAVREITFVSVYKEVTSGARYVTAVHMILLVKSDFRLPISRITKCSVKMSVNRSMQLRHNNNRFYNV